MFRVHGSVLDGVHMPWSYDEQTLERYERSRGCTAGRCR